MLPTVILALSQQSAAVQLIPRCISISSQSISPSSYAVSGASFHQTYLMPSIGSEPPSDICQAVWRGKQCGPGYCCSLSFCWNCLMHYCGLLQFLDMISDVFQDNHLVLKEVETSAIPQVNSFNAKKFQLVQKRIQTKQRQQSGGGSAAGCETCLLLFLTLPSFSYAARVWEPLLIYGLLFYLAIHGLQGVKPQHKFGKLSRLDCNQH